ncbi:MAG: hypothetical protein KBG28_13390 [Kofleriaceae bacterium]|jgi:hypothetical protein|nr:hypothetical protein [Kofleriaceae bacterium]MBP6835712.1 hypothetical protein [Kofleriaceae bacterium]MBP9204959.1 hypothetical protein [Kofleriaceae bacterium]
MRALLPVLAILCAPGCGQWLFDSQGDLGASPDAAAGPSDGRSDAGPSVMGDAGVDGAASRCVGYAPLGALPGLYLPVATAATWAEAVAACAADGAHLFIPDDDPELVTVTQLAFPTTLWQALDWQWVGISDQAIEGVWRRVDGEPATFLPWDVGQPDDFAMAEDCVQAAPTAGLNDLGCDQALAYVCECGP